MFYEFIKFLVYSGLIVAISKYILVSNLRKLAENLNLKAKTVGDIAGAATSVPELLTIIISSTKWMISTSIYNILSSNIINFIQYMASIIINKNRRAFGNLAIRIDIILVFLTIVIPITLIWLNIEISIYIIPIFVLLYLLFNLINNNTHKLYLKKEENKLEKQIENEEKTESGNTRKTLVYVAVLLLSGILLFVVGDLLGQTIENLANRFNISQTIIGILLGITTSIPELITFFESQKHYNNQKNEILGVVEATNNLLTSNLLNLFVIETIGIIILTFVTWQIKARKIYYKLWKYRKD